MSTISRFINYIYCWVYSSYILHKKLNKILQEPDWSFVQFWNLKSLYFTYSHSFSFFLWLAVIRCHSLSFFVTCSHSLSLVAIRYHSLSVAVIGCHSLSFVVIRCTTCCDSLYHSLSLFFVRCTTRCHSFSLVIVRCHSLYHSLSLFVPLVVTRCHLSAFL